MNESLNEICTMCGSKYVTLEDKREGYTICPVCIEKVNKMIDRIVDSFKELIDS